MSIETEIQIEVEALKARFPETKALYREVCALLFFRHGITPTANKLYQFVRKGSMSAPSDALNRFWEELRSKAQVRIDHPDLPESLKAAAAEAVQVLWVQATELARRECEALRVEAQTAVQTAQDESRHERQRAEDATAQVAAARERLEFEAAAWRARDSEHEAECRAHAATVGRNQELQRQITDLQGQLERARSDFAAELEKGRLAIAAADERAAGVQRHALREMEQERTARARSDKQVEALRGQVGELERRHGAQEAESAAAQGQLRAELSTAHAQAREHAAITESARTELDRTQQMLIAAQQEAIRFRTEALTLRELVERFRPAEKVERPKKSKTP